MSADVEIGEDLEAVRNRQQDGQALGLQWERRFSKRTLATFLAITEISEGLRMGLSPAARDRKRAKLEALMQMHTDALRSEKESPDE